MNTKTYFEMFSSNYTFFADGYLSGIKIVEDSNVYGLGYYGPFKTSQKGFSYLGLKINGILYGRVLYCYEDYPKVS